MSKAVPLNYWEIHPRSLFNSLDNLQRKGQPVLQASTVLIISPVPNCGLKLIEEVALMGVQLYCVYSGAADYFRSELEGFNQILNFPDCQSRVSI